MLEVPPGEEDDFLITQILEYIDRCIDLSTPCACYSVFDNPELNMEGGLMKLEGKTFHLNKMVTAALKKSTGVAIFAGTCGPGVEALSKDLMKEGHSLGSYLVDLIGSEIAEGVADFIHKRIEADMEALGIHITNRYSPGYCQWPVSDQQQLFALLGSNNCGIELTESSLMIPIKSVSGLVGVGKEVKNKGYACAACDANYCIYRDKK